MANQMPEWLRHGLMTEEQRQEHEAQEAAKQKTLDLLKAMLHPPIPLTLDQYIKELKNGT